MNSYHERFRQNSGLSESDFEAIMAGAERFQHETESRVADPGTTERRREGRSRFHALLLDADSTGAEVFEFARSNLSPDGIYDQLNHEEDVELMRSVLSGGRLMFPRTEPAGAVNVLCRVVSLLGGNVPVPDPLPCLLVMTDCQYHPHATIHCVDENHNFYILVISRSLLFDVLPLSFICAEIALESQEEEPASFSGHFASPKIREYFNKSIHRIQLPYMLASAALGEKYRFAFRVGADAARHPWSFNLWYCMIAFVLGHELGHIFHGHMGGRDLVKSGMLECLLDESLSVCAVRDQPPFVVENYMRSCFESHAREFDADGFGLLVASNLAVDLFRDRSAGQLAASVVLGLVAWMDRMAFFLRERVDPVAIVGDEAYNKSALAIDLRIPRPSHPWGRSRHGLLSFYLSTFSQLHFTDDEWDSLQKGISNAHYLISSSARGALAATLFVMGCSHEVTSLLMPDGLVSTFWQRNADGSCTKVREIRTDPDSYFDLASHFHSSGE